MFLPFYSLVMNWVFPFEVILSDWVFYENTWCMSCHAYLRWQWDIMCHLMYVLVINLRVPPMNLCIGVDTRSWFSGRNFGALFEVLCVGWIDESEIVWCISYNHTHGYLRWHWSIEVTLGFWLICVLRCYSSTNSMIDRTERIASCYFTTDSWIDWSERITLRWFCTLQ